MRFMNFVVAREDQAVGPPPPALFAAIDELGREAAEKGVFVEAGGLGPTALGGQVRVEGGKVSVVDGPFAEAKEVVGGYAVYELPSKEEAMKWAVRFMELHRLHWPGWEGAAEVRQIMDGPPPME